MATTGDKLMPFGKYKGEPLSEIPTAYLDWLIGQERMQGKELQDDIVAHLNTRAEWKRMSQ
jgi:uncharacterized protein (DUF3820 family)